MLMEILDNEETTFDLHGHTENDGSGVHGLPPLSRESPAAFLHDLVKSASDWLADEAAEVDR